MPFRWSRGTLIGLWLSISLSVSILLGVEIWTYRNATQQSSATLNSDAIDKLSIAFGVSLAFCVFTLATIVIEALLFCCNWLKPIFYLVLAAVKTVLWWYFLIDRLRAVLKMPNEGSDYLRLPAGALVLPILLILEAMVALGFGAAMVHKRRMAIKYPDEKQNESRPFDPALIFGLPPSTSSASPVKYPGQVWGRP